MVAKKGRKEWKDIFDFAVSLKNFMQPLFELFCLGGHFDIDVYFTSHCF